METFNKETFQYCTQERRTEESIIGYSNWQQCISKSSPQFDCN